MTIKDRKVLVLGGYGLVGIAVCRELLARHPRELQIHSLRREEAEAARTELLAEFPEAHITVSAGDLFALTGQRARRETIAAQLDPLSADALSRFVLYQVLVEARADLVVDGINTSTGIAYRDVFAQAQAVLNGLEAAGGASPEAVESLLEALYVPRLIRHLQVLYRGMMEAGTKVYAKIGTTGTGGMGLNIPYTHSEDRPSRTLLSKTAMAGAQSMLLFLMARTPGAPITKEIKPAALIAWKRLAHGPIRRRGVPLERVTTAPRPLGATFSSHDPDAATPTGEVLQATFADTGENGLFSLEEFAAVTSVGQMEFVTPEEIAQYLVFEVEGGNTGYDIMQALDGAVLGPTYRAGALRSVALETMNALQREHGTWSVAFEMLGPPRISKLLFEAHFLRLSFGTFEAAAAASAEAICDQFDRLARERFELAGDALAVGLPILLDSGELLRGQDVLVPQHAENVAVTPEKVERWCHDGWVDLRLANCRKWSERLARIQAEIAAIPADETSSRYLRNRNHWLGRPQLEPGKLVAWVLSVEEEGARFKR